MDMHEARRAILGHKAALPHNEGYSTLEIDEFLGVRKGEYIFRCAVIGVWYGSESDLPLYSVSENGSVKHIRQLSVNDLNNLRQQNYFYLDERPIEMLTLEERVQRFKEQIGSDVERLDPEEARWMKEQCYLIPADCNTDTWRQYN